ncbi:hypothetical protein Mal15_56550 [Stieleria maiorica]|uniref:Uncharacterized protein n=1 Tax=Stieleria maiorica TaxID=2795974 RepID=A0A5B9MRC1_9BACT|nr:hypothetical protein [Stieleria maiorica]QEG01578.1 hypothetical protein Mal15_56550 [Stieleria maiorica]
MTNSLATLLAGSIDYAGIFPPAKLSVDQAVRSYVDYRQQADAWLLGRMVCGVDRLPELAACSSLLRGTPIRLTLVCPTVGDFKDVADFQRAQAAHFCVAALELKLPAWMVESVDSLDQFLDHVSKVTDALAMRNADVFLEIAAGDWGNALTNVLSSIQARGSTRVGLKIRLGGLSENALPTPLQVGIFIDACRSAGVRWKATAGLHHPLSRPKESGQTEFGFLNLFSAAVLACVHQLAPSQIAAILAETSADAFQFDERSMSWGDHGATLSEIADGRRESIRSFGSCSFEEPRDGLRQLNLFGASDPLEVHQTESPS